MNKLMSKTQTIVIIVGLPYSGKSAVAKEINNLLSNSIIISSDDIRREMFSNSKRVDKSSIFRELRKRVEMNLQFGRTVIVDACNVKKMYREELLCNISSGIQKICVYCHQSLDYCLQVNEKNSDKIPKEIIIQYFNNLTYPDKNEGFDYVINHK